MSLYLNVWIETPDLSHYNIALKYKAFCCFTGPPLMSSSPSYSHRDTQVQMGENYYTLNPNMCQSYYFNHYPAKEIYLNFQPREVVSRYRDPQPQVAENTTYLFNLSTNICKS